MQNKGEFSELREEEIQAHDSQNEEYLTFLSNRNAVVLRISTILYVFMAGNNAEIHVSSDKIYTTRMTLGELERKLGEGFIKVHRGCLVSVMAIHNITDSINLSNGESLSYTLRKKKEIIAQFGAKKKSMIKSYAGDDIPRTAEEYRKYYSSFEHLPFAFADIEMIFNKENHAVDWIFRYGNTQLEKLEKMSLNCLIGHSFGSLFPNMDSRWLLGYERATLYGEKLEMIDYSPEIDTYLKVICFPTFKGHCGCMLFDISEIEFTRNSIDSENALGIYLGRTSKRTD